ncbi:hypothetical protein P7K49_032803 [Saguinus oedipus]|uniref:Uncharacterized protein n=1 Tax=Saguinus oedipus TaxID=9490 RepID=A0ABQ9TQ49_SAGOE|nr:hypothetical protein P7K49_032803 [Saguinus oedipus]
MALKYVSGGTVSTVDAPGVHELHFSQCRVARHDPICNIALLESQIWGPQKTSARASQDKSHWGGPRSRVSSTRRPCVETWRPPASPAPRCVFALAGPAAIQAAAFPFPPRVELQVELRGWCLAFLTCDNDNLSSGFPGFPSRKGE